MGWYLLVLAGLFEVGFTTAMRHIDGTMPWRPILAFLVCATSSFGLLIAATQTLPIGTAYAIWTGIGAAGTVLVGIFLYGEAATTLRLALLTLLIGSIVGLKLVTDA